MVRAQTAEMRRTIWLSLFCLVGLAILASVRALSLFAVKDVPKIPDNFDHEGAAPLALKTDKLVDNEEELRSDKVTIKSIKIFVRPPTLKKRLPVFQRSAGVRPTGGCDVIQFITTT